MTERRLSTRTREVVEADQIRRDNKRKLMMAIGGLVAVLAIVFVGVLWQQSEADQERIRTVLADVDSALEVESPSREELRALRKQLEALESEFGRADDRTIARVRVEAGLGRYEDAWELIATVAERPGAASDMTWVGAEIGERRHSRVGGEDLGARVLALAESSIEDKGSAALALAVQMAHRIGDVDGFLDLSDRLRSDYGASSEAREFEVALSELAVQLALRIGIRGADLEATTDPLGQRIAGFIKETLPSRDVDGDVSEMPEVAIVQAAGRLEKSPDVATAREALSILRDVADRVPSSLEARRAQVPALFVLWQKKVASETDLSQLRGQLNWLQSNATKEHAQRGSWQQLLDALAR